MILSRKQKIKQLFIHFKSLLPNLREIDDGSLLKQPLEKPAILQKKQKIISLRKPIQAVEEKKPIYLKLGEIYGKMAQFEDPERMNSARNVSQKEEDYDSHTSLLKQRRRSLSFATNNSNSKRNYPVSARNYEETSRRNENELKTGGNESTLSEIHESNEIEENVERPKMNKKDFDFTEELIAIQNKLIKEKNQEIWYWKSKCKPLRGFKINLKV